MPKRQERKVNVMKELNAYFKSIIDQERVSVVICNLQHEIIYMNPAAIKNYAKRGGEALIGKSLLACHNPESNKRIQQVVDWFAADVNHNIVYTSYNAKQNVIPAPIYITIYTGSIPSVYPVVYQKNGKNTKNVKILSALPQDLGGFTEQNVV